MDSFDPLEELRGLCPGARQLHEAGLTYIDLPALGFLSSGQKIVRDALLCLGPHSGYPTRLFLSAPVTGRGNNWRQYVILGRTWHSWSWNHVPAGWRPAQILAEHLRALA